MGDYINATFELLAGGFVLVHCRRVMKDKQVKGVSIVATSFFALWGFWNLYYYPSLGQWWSLWGGLSVVTANCVRVALMVRYRNSPVGA